MKSTITFLLISSCSAIRYQDAHEIKLLGLQQNYVNTQQKIDRLEELQSQISANPEDQGYNMINFLSSRDDGEDPKPPNQEKATDPFDPKSIKEAEARKSYKKKLENQPQLNNEIGGNSETTDLQLAKIGRTGLNSEVGDFLEDLDSSAVIPPNLGFVQTNNIYIPKIGQSGLDGQVGEFLEDLNSWAEIPPNLGFVQTRMRDPARIGQTGLDGQVGEFLEDLTDTAVIPPNLGFVQTRMRDPATIGQSGLDGQVGEFLEDLTGEAVIPPNLGFIQTKYRDHYDDDFHPDFPNVILPDNIKPVKGINYRTAREEKINDQVKAMAKKLEAKETEVKDADFKEKYGKTPEQKAQEEWENDGKKRPPVKEDDKEDKKK